MQKHRTCDIISFMENKEFITEIQKNSAETVLSSGIVFKRSFIMTLLLIYILSPVDFIPDIIFPFGITDDIVSLFLLYRIGIKTWNENKQTFFRILIFLTFIFSVSVIGILYIFMR